MNITLAKPSGEIVKTKEWTIYKHNVRNFNISTYEYSETEDIIQYRIVKEVWEKEKFYIERKDIIETPKGFVSKIFSTKNNYPEWRKYPFFGWDLWFNSKKEAEDFILNECDEIRYKETIKWFSMVVCFLFNSRNYLFNWRNEIIKNLYPSLYDKFEKIKKKEFSDRKELEKYLTSKEMKDLYDYFNWTGKTIKKEIL